VSSILYKRVLLKLSGEVLMGAGSYGIDSNAMKDMTDKIISLAKTSVEICLVIGGGNIFRGVSSQAKGMDRTVADSLGILATIMNGIALRDALEQAGLEALLFSAVDMPKICPTYRKEAAEKALSDKKIVIFSGGIGHPYFSTDTAAVLRACELGCDIVVKATKVEGVFDKDPEKHQDAEFIEKLTYHSVLNRGLKVMDMTAISLADENNMPLLVCSVHSDDAFKKVLQHKGRYTKITKG